MTGRIRARAPFPRASPRMNPWKLHFLHVACSIERERSLRHGIHLRIQHLPSPPLATLLPSPRHHHHPQVCPEEIPLRPPDCRRALTDPTELHTTNTSRAMATLSPQSAQAPTQSVFPKSHVGFDSITNQIEKKLLKRGFQFNVICVGK